MMIDVLCWRCADDNIYKFIGVTDNVYDELSHEDMEKKNKYIMKGSDNIVSMLYIKEILIYS